ncbi:Protein priA [Vanrija pseudolonga]|uniref:Protein priA n=1 Tax=Vanrija pseudolonga TaxID=143232 RepID=A0AAF1BHG5_9TREE|nr:Protein priA [Vanrija pseudolonga]
MLKATFILALVASASAYDAFGDNAYPAAGGGRHHAQLREPAAAGLGIWDEGNDFGLGLRYATGHSAPPPPPPQPAAPHAASTDGNVQWGRARACAGSLLALLTGNPITLNECMSPSRPAPRRQRVCEAGLEGCGALCIDPTVTSCELEADMLVPAPKRGRKSGLDACPRGHKVCTLRTLDIGCVDTSSDVGACGGCPEVDGVDCTGIEGVLDTECAAGQCRALSCLDGWELAGDECVYLGPL